VTDRIGDEWFTGMTSGNSIHTIAAGTRTLETTNGITVSGNTFSLTATTMAASKTFVWQAVMILGMVGLLKRGADKFYKQPSRDRDYSRYFF